jgi:hypothetical protein
MYDYTTEAMNKEFVEVCERRQNEYGKLKESPENRTGEVATC